jgi:type VI secretion system secreted protein Hcp
MNGQPQVADPSGFARHGPQPRFPLDFPIHAGDDPASNSSGGLHMKFLLCLLVAGLFSAHALLAQTITVTIAFDSSSGINNGNPISVLTFKIGAVQPQLSTYSGGGASAGKSQFTPLMVFKNIDGNSPILFLDCATGKLIKDAILTVSGSGDSGQTYFQIALKDVYIASINDDSTDADGGEPYETFTLSYREIGWQYSSSGDESVVNGGFDVIKNAAVNWNQITNAGSPLLDALKPNK